MNKKMAQRRPAACFAASKTSAFSLSYFLMRYCNSKSRVNFTSTNQMSPRRQYMSEYTLSAKPKFYFSFFLQETKATAVTKLPFYLPENMVNHKKMVHPPCVRI